MNGQLPDEESIRDQEKRGLGLKVRKMEGNLVWYEGHLYPWRGIPRPNAVKAANEIKKALKWCGLKKIPWKNMVPFLLTIDERQTFTSELFKFFQHFTTGYPPLCLAHVFEYDAAYRWRLQYLLSHAITENLVRQPYLEVWRLMAINKKREKIPDVHRKLWYGALLLTVALLWPPFRRKWKQAVLNADYIKFLPDQNDAYWMSLRKDYDFSHI